MCFHIVSCLQTSGTSGQSHDMTCIFRSFSLEPATVPVPLRNASGDHGGHELKTSRIRSRILKPQQTQLAFWCLELLLVEANHQLHIIGGNGIMWPVLL